VVANQRPSILVAGFYPQNHLIDHNFRVITHNPGLKRTLPESVIAAYALARIVAARETWLAERTFPPASPCSFEQMTDADFWPNS
jgi:hypothetical protein